MSAIKHYLEQKSEDIGLQGVISKRVINKVSKEQNLEDRPRRKRRQKSVEETPEKPKTVKLDKYPVLQKLERETSLKVAIINEKYVLTNKGEALKTVQRYSTLETLEAHVKYNYRYFWGFYNVEIVKKK